MTRRSGIPWLRIADEARAWELARREPCRPRVRPLLRHGHHQRPYQPKAAGASPAERFPGGLDPASVEAIHALLPEVSTHLLGSAGHGPDPALSEMVSRVLGLSVLGHHGPATNPIPHSASSK